MNTATPSIVVGILAGIASAMLVLSGTSTISFVTIILSLCAIIPVLLAGLGWSNLAGGVAVLSGSLVVGVMFGPVSAFSLAITSLIPGAWIAHLSNLGRPAEEIGGQSGETAWYPLCNILLYICGISAGMIIINGLMPGVAEVTRSVMEQQFGALMEQNPELQESGMTTEAFVDSALLLTPAIQAFGAVLILFSAWYVTTGIARLSGRAKRPRDYVPAGLRMPRIALPVLAAALAMCFVGGAMAPFGFAISGAFIAGFTLSGLAMLHHTTRGKPWRFLALWVAYAAALVISLPLVAFFIAGLLGTIRASAPTSPNNNDTTI